MEMKIFSQNFLQKLVVGLTRFLAFVVICQKQDTIYLFIKTHLTLYTVLSLVIFENDHTS